MKEVEAWELRYRELECGHRQRLRGLAVRATRHRVVGGIHARESHACRAWLRSCLAAAVAGRFAAERAAATAAAASQRARFADFLFETRHEATTRRLQERAAHGWAREAHERATLRRHQDLVCTKAMRSAWRLEATWGMNRARTVAVEAARGVARAEAEETLARLVAEERSHREDVEALTEELRSEAAAFARMQGA